MAVCAIVCARVRDGAGSVYPTASASSSDPTPSSEDLFRAAIDAFPSSLSQARAFDFKRTQALLAIACIQYGDVAEHHTHLGQYIVLASIDGDHDEARWPMGLTEPEVQERRRLFWSTYTLEVFSAITWGGIIRQRESQCNVAYPAEVYDDEDITETGSTTRALPAQSFLHGWNFTTDMYRMLEHLLDRLRSRRTLSGANTSFQATSLFATDPGPSSGQQVLEQLAVMYDRLPPEFKAARAMTGNIELDRFGFQGEIQLSSTADDSRQHRRHHADGEDGHAGAEEFSVDRRCAIAGELLDALSAIPTAYIAAISSPMLHHLASVGHLLGTVIQVPLSQWSFLQVRNVLSAMADLLAGLEHALHFTHDISTKLKSHVSRIDEYMSKAATEAERSQVYHHALPRPTRFLQPVSLDHGVQGGRPDLSSPAQQAVPLAPPDPSSGGRFELSPAQQMQLQTDLTTDWPFEIGNGTLDFFTDWSNLSNFPAGIDPNELPSVSGSEGNVI